MVQLKLMSLRFIGKVKKSLLTVLILSLSASLFAANSLSVKVGYYNFPRYQEGTSDSEKKSGYAYEYLQKIASYTGWNYEYVYGERANLLKDLKNGKIDVLVGLPKEQGVTQDYIYSLRPTILATYYLFQAADSNKLNIARPESFNDAKIGLLKGSDGADKIIRYVREKELNCTFVEYTDYKAFRTGFFNKEFDAFVSTDLELSDNTHVSIVDSIGNHSLYAALSIKTPEIAEAFNEAQEKIRETEPLYLEHLRSKYFDERLSSLIVEKKDLSWFNTHNEIRIGYIEDYMPFCGNSANGEVSGILTDIVYRFDSFIKNNNVHIIYTPYKEYPDAMKGLNSGEIDLLFPFYGDYWFAEQHNFQISDEIYSLSMVLLADRKKEFNEVKTLAVSKRSPLQIFYVDTYFPDVEVKYFDSFEDCIDAIKSKKVDATISNIFRATDYINYNTSSTLDIKELKGDCPIAFAVNRKNTDLLQLIEHCLLKMDYEFIHNSVYQNSYSTRRISVDEFISQNAFVFIAIILVIAAFILAFAHIYVTKTKKRNAVVRAQKQQLEKILREEMINTATIRSVSKMYIALYYINMNDYAFTEMYANDDNIRTLIGKTGNALIQFDQMNNNMVSAEYHDSMCQFNDLTTLKERMGDRTYISKEFRGVHYGWCEAFFIVSERNTSDNFAHVIYAVRSIEKEKELLVRSNTDELTGCLNRRSYEEDVKTLSEELLPENLIITSFDVNGLKNANDDIGHDAGDELIIGAARCMEKAFSPYGKVYRVGGDEFIAVIEATKSEYDNILDFFETELSEWKGKLVEKLNVSYGSASVEEYPDMPVTEIAKISDKRMYSNKELFYSRKGVDRRSSQAAFETLRVTYTKILKVNLATDDFTVMMMDESERTEEKGFRTTISEWLKAFADAGQVHPEDKEKYLEGTDLNYMKDYFKKENKILTIRYRRMTNNVFQDSIMDIIPVSNYSESNQIVFLYVKNI